MATETGFTPWTLTGKEFGNCNCAFGCPCQFNALPTHGHCRAAAGFQIETGHYGDVKLDGLRAVGLYVWPGAVHEGNGTMQLIVDERASAEQREALSRILSGADTDPMATMWSVFAATCPNRLEPLVRPIELQIDVSARRAQLRVPGVIETTAQPILNPVTGAEHRARIDMPEGFEYRLAEVGRGSTKARGEITLDLRDTHAHLAEIRFDNHGVVQ